jgi:hypothetical protein
VNEIVKSTNLKDRLLLSEGQTRRSRPAALLLCPTASFLHLTALDSP